MKIKSAFTLIELMVVIAIIGILVSISTAGIIGSRQTARDTLRKADLENIKTAVELYYSDCRQYPPAISQGGEIVGPDSSSYEECSDSPYMAEVPSDPQAARRYAYQRDLSNPDWPNYSICASLEDPEDPTADFDAECGGGEPCGAGLTCNYRVTQ